VLITCPECGGDVSSEAVACPKCGKPIRDTGRAGVPDAVYLARYAEHSSRLQTWIGGYGAGLASLLVYQFRTAVGDTKALWEARGATAALLRGNPLDVVLWEMHLRLSQSLRLIAVALAIQVALLTLNKYTQLVQAHAPDDVAEQTCGQRLAISICNHSWIDLVCDVASIGLLALGTVYGLEALGIQP